MVLGEPEAAQDVGYPDQPTQLSVEVQAHAEPMKSSSETNTRSPGSGVVGTQDLTRNNSEGVEFVSWDGTDDPENPKNWPVKTKWRITAVCCLLCINVTFASSAPTAVLSRITNEFSVSEEVGNLITTIFLLGYVFGPLIWGPGSELLGRKPVFIMALTPYIISILGQALARNFATLLVTRFISGVFAVAPLTTCGGTIADTWDPVGRGKATSLFSASIFLGPVLGPLVGGFVADSDLKWNWIFWIMMMFAGSCTLFMVIFLPETYAPVLLKRKARKLRKQDPVRNKNLFAESELEDWSVNALLQRTLFRPFKMLSMEPILVLITLYMSLAYGVLYALFEALPIIFTTTRHLSLSQTGLIFIGVGIGSTLGATLNLILSSRYRGLVIKWRGYPPPENRLYGAMVGGILLVIGSFWLGWTGAYAGIPWFVPALSTPPIGAGIALIFMSHQAYMVDTYLTYSASAFAANITVRSVVGAAFPLFTARMYSKMGINWASTLIGCISILLCPIPFVFFKYGARIRKRSKFAPCIDLKIAKEMEEEKRRSEEDSAV